MASGQNKISPRKFSEKIALLNKKEAEGNAEFEEIIKEVQATRSAGSSLVPSRSSSARSRRSGTGTTAATTTTTAPINSSAPRPAKERKELEEVFENLIKCVGQYEQELQDERLATNDDPSIRDDDTQCARSASAMAAGCSVQSQPIENVPTSMNIIFQTPQKSTATANANNNNNDLNNIPYGRVSATTNDNNNANFGQLTDQSPSNFYNSTASMQQNTSNISTAASSAYRARVTSFGSATNYKYMQCTNNQAQQQQQQQNHHHQIENSSIVSGSGRYNNNNIGQDGWPASSEMYLKPTCDKSWQKSCSDPTLHVPCAPINNTAFYSDNLLVDTMEVDNNNNTNSHQQQHQHQKMNDNATINIGNEQQENIGPNEDNLLGLTYMAGGQQEMSADNRCSLTGQVQLDEDDERQLNYIADMVSLSSVGQASNKNLQCFNQQQQQHIPASNVTPLSQRQQHHQMQLESQQSRSNYNNNTNLSMMGDLPGINICAIDDENLQLGLIHEPGSSASRDSSLPDISNLQFGGVTDHHQQQPIDRANDDDAAQNGFHSLESHLSLSSEPTYQTTNSAIESDECQQQQQQQVAKWAQQQSMNIGSGSGQLMTSYNSNAPTFNWPSDPNESLGAPKVGSLLSSSDCGSLQISGTNNHFQGLGLAAPIEPLTLCAGGGNNIVRSHSHNSINHFDKQRRTIMPATNFLIPNSNSNLNPNHHHQQHHHRHNKQRQRHQNQSHQVAFGGQYDEQRRPMTNDQFCAAASNFQDGTRYGFSLSNSSMRPQLGSMSPLDSSTSNLTSPQSEQNSPGSSITGGPEYGEYLPYEAASPQNDTLQQSQQSQSQCQQQQRQQLAEPPPLLLGEPNLKPIEPIAQQQQQQAAAYHYNQQLPLPVAGANSQIKVGAPNSTCELGHSSSTSIGPCQSPSCSRRLHNQVCRGAYAQQPASASAASCELNSSAARGANGKSGS